MWIVEEGFRDVIKTIYALQCLIFGGWFELHIYMYKGSTIIAEKNNTVLPLAFL